MLDQLIKYFKEEENVFIILYDAYKKKAYMLNILFCTYLQICK